MIVLSIENMASIIHKHTLKQYFIDLSQQLKKDFSCWEDFNKIPRPAFHVPDGVIELMPTANNEYFAYKYVNGHPKNPLKNKQTVVATGQLSNICDGYPVMASEMTLMTGLRTAATSALATDMLARRNAQTLTLIGTGAQSDFQALACAVVRDIKTIKFYDIDPKAMLRFEKNMKKYNFNLVPCKSAQEAVFESDIITVCTACKAHANVVLQDWIKPGMHINALGGDCPGKTELEKGLLKLADKVVVEFFDQSFIEGEIQNFSLSEAQNIVYAEMFEIINKSKNGRENNDEITIFDSVGFALEDFSVLVLSYNLAKKYSIGENINMVPDLDDPKNLFSVLNENTINDSSLKI